ncbi:hypothetical protein AKJ09_02879 [Labilithrix luteola]|uniref:Uncharacterized protein n=1 Tax=Labilithrix luteola TaxID=1391654 RepID=A0A0K1PRQ6_9BACT|nr:hypothetical protein AKJ09_02879 [Labilithrix luteola]
MRSIAARPERAGEVVAEPLVEPAIVVWTQGRWRILQSEFWGAE